MDRHRSPFIFKKAAFPFPSINFLSIHSFASGLVLFFVIAESGSYFSLLRLISAPDKYL